MGRRLGRSMTSVSNVTNDLIPDAPNVRNVGSAAFPFKALYVEDQVVTDDIVFSNPLTGIVDNLSGLSALGTNQATANTIVATVTLAVNADGVKGIKLPVIANIPEKMALTVINNSAASNLNVYADAVGTLINGVAGTTAFVIPPHTTVSFRKTGSAAWYSTRPSNTIDTPFNGNLVFGTALKGVANNIATLAGLGTTQADAAPVVTTVARVTGANGTVGVKLPALASVPAGFGMKIINSDVTNLLKVYSNAAGELISGQAGTTAISLAAKLVLTVTKFDATNWYAEKSVLPY